MSEHTKEPWICDERLVYKLNEQGYNIFSASIQDAHTSKEELEANAKRIVACVNACAGIDTESLESGEVSINDQTSSVAESKDLLLVVLKDIRDAMVNDQSIQLGMYGHLLLRANDAIQNAEATND